MKDEEYLRKETEGKRKCEKTMQENYGKKTYISNSKIVEVRNIFKARVGMTEFAENFSNDRRFMRTNWECRCGYEKESENHIKQECLIYNDLKDDYEDLSDDKQLASFFCKVLERRGLVDAIEEGEREDNTMAARVADVLARTGAMPARADLLV